MPSFEIRELSANDIALRHDLLTNLGKGFEDPETNGAAWPDDAHLRKLLGPHTFIALAEGRRHAIDQASQRHARKFGRLSIIGRYRLFAIVWLTLLLSLAVMATTALSGSESPQLLTDDTNMTTNELYAQLLLELEKSVAGPNWIEPAPGVRALQISQKALLSNDVAAAAWTGTPPKESDFVLFSTTPILSDFRRFETSALKSALLIWPGDLKLDQGARIDIRRLGTLTYHSEVWPINRLVTVDPATDRARDMLMNSPKAEPEDLIEDLKAREKWFRQRH